MFTVAMLASVTLGQAPAPGPSDRAIAEATRVLRAAAEKCPAGPERDRIEAAMLALVRVSETPQTDNEKVADLADRTLAYKGKSLTLVAELEISPGLTLRAAVGQQARFRVVSPSGAANATLLVDLPRTLTVPNVGDGERVFLTFTCGGDLRKGNVATAIRRVP